MNKRRRHASIYCEWTCFKRWHCVGNKLPIFSALCYRMNKLQPVWTNCNQGWTSQAISNLRLIFNKWEDQNKEELINHKFGNFYLSHSGWGWSTLAATNNPLSGYNKYGAVRCNFMFCFQPKNAFLSGYQCIVVHSALKWALEVATWQLVPDIKWPNNTYK